LRIHAIPPGIAFLPALAQGIRERLPAPDALARATILLPTRRSARALRAAFMPAEEGAALLPRMRALAGLSTEDADELALPALLELPPAVAPLRRQAVLAEMAMRLPPSRGGPPTPEQAWGLAGELATLFDEIALEEADATLLRQPARLQAAWLEKLEGLVKGELAIHWQVTTAFLRGVAEAWQGWLEDRELLDIGLRRVLALSTQADAWEAAPPPEMVVAAGIGTGGTVPAAARLLRVIAQHLPQGFVVLHAEDAATAELAPDGLDAAPTHPFQGQRRLLRLMAETRLQFPPWTTIPEAPPRAALLGQALRPAAALPAWQSRRPDHWAPALAGLSAATAPDAEHEARAIALLLREALEQPGARAALVTPDRDLARRTMAALARHGIAAEDSAGQPLSMTEQGAFLRLVAAMVASDFAPVPLLSVLKHPLCAGGWDRSEWLAATRLLERAALRGPRPAAGLDGLAQAVPMAAPPQCLGVVEALGRALGPFTALPAGIARPPAALLAELLAAAEALAATGEAPGGLALYAGDAGEALAEHLADMQQGFEELPPIAPARFPALFEAALAQGVARRPRAHDAHPRVAILGLLEARLLHFDRVVLGGLDETVWPVATDPGPWMGRPMRERFGLPAPEARIGRVAADFLLTACAAPDAVLSRATRRGGAPTVPARWLTRLSTFLRGQRAATWPEGLALPDNPAPAWAAQLDQPAAAPVPATRPRPAPPRAARPARVSVTEVATLLADPYAFYARRMLHLAPLDPIDAQIGAAEYGEVVHDAMAQFLRTISPHALPGDAAALWDAAATKAMDKAALRPSLRAFWTPRLSRIGAFIREQEAALRHTTPLARTHQEVKAEAVISGITLHGRADRVDECAAGGVLILDYKTGALPSNKEVETGAQPQLPLEALLAAHGAFQGIPASDTRSMAYWKLTGGVPPGEVMQIEEMANLMAQAEEMLDSIAKTLLRGDAPFTARPHPGRQARGTDYDHLARRAEWQDSP